MEWVTQLHRAAVALARGLLQHQGHDLAVVVQTCVAQDRPQRGRGGQRTNCGVLGFCE